MTDTPHATEPDDVSPEPSPPATIPAPAGRSHGRRHGRWVVVVLAGALAVVINAGVLLGTRIIGVWGPDSTAAVDVTVPSPTEPASPFAGTPAEDFAEGEAGIVLPEAEPIGEFTAEEVAEALELVRDALIAARLDPTMLVDHDPDSFLALIVANQQAPMHRWFDSGESRRFATQVAGDLPLAAVPPRVDGRISSQVVLAGAQDTPVIEVTTRFVWVYAFEPGGESPGDRLAVIRDEAVWQVKYGLPWTESSEGLSQLDATARTWGADCEAFDDGLLRPVPGSLAKTGDDPGMIFDPDAPLDPENTC